MNREVTTHTGEALARDIDEAIIASANNFQIHRGNDYSNAEIARDIYNQTNTLLITNTGPGIVENSNYWSTNSIIDSYRIMMENLEKEIIDVSLIKEEFESKTKYSIKDILPNYDELKKQYEEEVELELKEELKKQKIKAKKQEKPSSKKKVKAKPVNLKNSRTERNIKLEEQWTQFLIRNNGRI